MADVLAEHYGYDDYQGRWWETYRGEVHVTRVVANPSPYLPDHDMFWAMLVMGEMDDE